MVPSSIGPYRIVDRLGSGANGEVYLAEDTRLGRKVAVKTLSALDSKDLTEARSWVLREARADVPWALGSGPRLDPDDDGPWWSPRRRPDFGGHPGRYPLPDGVQSRLAAK